MTQLLYHLRTHRAYQPSIAYNFRFVRTQTVITRLDHRPAGYPNHSAQDHSTKAKQHSPQASKNKNKMCTETTTIYTQCHCTKVHSSYCAGALSDVEKGGAEKSGRVPEYKNCMALKKVQQAKEDICGEKACPEAKGTVVMDFSCR